MGYRFWGRRIGVARLHHPPPGTHASFFGAGDFPLGFEVALLIVGHGYRDEVDAAGEGERAGVRLADRRAKVTAAVEAGSGRIDRPGARELAGAHALAVDRERATPPEVASLGECKAQGVPAGRHWPRRGQDVAREAGIVFVDEVPVLDEQRIATEATASSQENSFSSSARGPSAFRQDLDVGDDRVRAIRQVRRVPAFEAWDTWPERV